MPLQINKKKIYFYLLVLIFLSTSFNLSLISKINDTILLKKINITGISEKEKKILLNKLKIFENNNIFFLDKKEILNILDFHDFIDSFFIQKVLPEKLIINIKKTNFLGSTIVNGDKFYIGSNGKLTPINQVENEKNLPLVFGKFPIKEFLSLQKILLMHEIDLKNIKKYYYHKSRRWDLEFSKDLTLMLPSKNIDSSLKIYKSLVRKKKIGLTRIVDLRVPKNIILTNEKN